MPFEDILGGCEADGQIVVKQAPGTRVDATVHVNLISQDLQNVVGWHLGIAVDGAVRIADATFSGTAGALRPNGFSLPDEGFAAIAFRSAPDDDGHSWLQSIIGLTKAGVPAGFPATGTQSVLKLTLQSDDVQGDAAQRAVLSITDDLPGCAADFDPDQFGCSKRRPEINRSRLAPQTTGERHHPECP